MKKLTGLVVILAVLILGGYYGMGYMTETSVKRTVDNLGQVNGLSADLQAYDRGWFTSKALINWKLHVPERVAKQPDGQSKTVPAQDYKIQMPLTVYHGPIIFSPTGVHFGSGYAHTDLKLPQEYSKQLDTMFAAESGEPKLAMSLYVNYFNKSYVSVGVPAFKLIAKKGDGRFEWGGMKSTTSMSSNLDKVSGKFYIDGLHLLKDATKINMGKFITEYNLHAHSTGLMLGKLSVYLPSFVVLSDKDKIFEIDAFSFSSTSQVNNDLLDAYAAASLKNIFADGQNYGPGKLEMSLKNLDAEVLAKLNTEAAAAQNGPDAQRQQALLAMLPELPKLLNKGAQFEISTLHFTMPQGAIDGHLLIALPKDENVNPFELLAKVKGNGKLTIPAAVLNDAVTQSVKQQMLKQPSMQQALIEQMQKDQPEEAQAKPSIDQLAYSQAQQKITHLTQSGLLEKQADNYVIAFHLEQGKFTINGQPFNPAMVNF